MYGFILGVLKLLSDGLTAASGIYGLLSDFRDAETKRITHAGTRAIIGIAAGFLISGVITAFEYEKAIAEERAHALEIKRLTNPLGQIEIRVSWEFDNNNQEVAAFTKRLESTAPYVDSDGLAGSLPSGMRDSLWGRLEWTADPDIFIYKRGSGHPCPTGLPLPDADLELGEYDPPFLKDDRFAVIEIDRSRKLRIMRVLNPTIKLSTGEIASDEDLAAVGLMMNLVDDTYWPSDFVLRTIHGRYFRPGPKSVTRWGDKGVQYCYVLEASAY